ncbi:hypothetical protein [Mycolicibacterium sp. 050158]|uniref:hypothetical protein n=1 Tax=Mycolicibacterium sp. 050158 TaxID=3090602 RepID=UPI00299D2ED7|nr:hypothetical protein [Mycolicibacterium sp. 050158]MDX1888359.1 hypothetical protein [Mycolicibacterium sp. 050158]
MAERFDVAARLAEGRPAVDDVTECVAACHRLGYQHPDLTLAPNQVRDWYGGEEGLDLHALDTDHTALSAAAVTVQDAARRQAELTSALAAAWSGGGGEAAREFAWRSGQAATSVGDALHATADAVATLRDALWRAVDAKVAATEALAAGLAPQRAEWLAAASTVTTGAGDLAAASELVDQRVTPYVDGAVGSEWVAAMRSAGAAIDAAYAALIGTVTATAPAVFEMPGEFGTGSGVTHRDIDVDAPRSTAQAVPAAAVQSATPTSASAGPASVASWPAPAPTPAPAPAPPPTPTAPAAQPTDLGAPPTAAPPTSSLPGLGDLAGATSPLGSGLSGFGQQLADLIGGLVGGGHGGAPDAANVDDLDATDDPPDDGDTDELDGAQDGEDPKDGEDPDDQDDPAEDDPDEAKAAEETTTEPAVGLTEPPQPDTPEPQPLPTPPPEPVPPAPPAAEAAAQDPGPTPCEIAADELPQVGPTPGTPG